MTIKLKLKTWAAFKSIVTQRSLYVYQEDETDTCYLLLANDNGIIIRCYICKTETENIEDYETNWQGDITKACANGDHLG